MIHQIDSKNGWLLLSASFTVKFGLVFVLTFFKKTGVPLLLERTKIEKASFPYKKNLSYQKPMLRQIEW